jgi:DNA-binding beta-propeller fold protein YncE
MICNRQWLVFILVFVLVWTAGCAKTEKILRYEVDPVKAEVWPSPPDKPRFRYVGQLTGEQNVHVEKESRFIHILKAIVGLGSGVRRPDVLQRPQSGVVDNSRGRIYVTDVSRGAVYVFDEQQGELSIWDRAESNGAFATPIGIALGKNGEVLVADADLALVVRLDPNGEPLGTFGSGVLKRPVGIARDPERGVIYVSDTHAHDIKMFSDSGELIKVIGSRGQKDGEFNFPTFIAFSNNKLYVTDTMNSRVQVLTSEGNFIRKFGNRGLNIGNMPRPKGITLDSDGNIYIVESFYDYLLVYNSAGDFLLPIGGTGSDVGQFYLPSGVWSDSRNRIYIADMFNGRVVILQYLGNG